MKLKKIRSIEEIIKISNDLKIQNKKVVVLSGSFDILHTGHIKTFEEARAQGDCLIVLLNSDKSVKKYKGPTRPIINENDRATILNALESIDYIVIFDEITPINALEQIKPNIFCQGLNWGKDCLEKDTIEKNGGTIYILKWEQGQSSTNLIEQIKKVENIPVIKAIFLDRDGTININEPEYLHKIQDFKFTERAVEGLKKMAENGYKLFIVSNQSGIGRGYYLEQEAKELSEWLISELEEHGVKIEKIYYCPHKPEDKCECRKPSPKMLFDAVDEFGVSLNNSWVIGDSEKDILLGKFNNVRTILINKNKNKDTKADFTVTNLFEAAEIISNNS